MVPFGKQQEILRDHRTAGKTLDKKYNPDGPRRVCRKGIRCCASPETVGAELNKEAQLLMSEIFCQIALMLGGEFLRRRRTLIEVRKPDQGICPSCASTKYPSQTCWFIYDFSRDFCNEFSVHKPSDLLGELSVGGSNSLAPTAQSSRKIEFADPKSGAILTCAHSFRAGSSNCLSISLPVIARSAQKIDLG